ncbi:DNA-directed RNA polymerase III subunit RPC1 [Fonticula alba]|uniref:DNA-directed RNA polymerase subunit n=1 Tax=Fonticula alba TaxID=691883 RepID=A0A058ZG75_FONAL|nr:DNA-directed RNA polymerase III subunit RPC1 [Fonticula alba]KCV73369.1 DNA-directed RNA polymerase III subunit RPC1 [Fonticula alba]|eukprot:XP_009493070.1 DNA-directed RNA polymerase III subunit RPC1 [Fonticula alba]
MATKELIRPSEAPKKIKALHFGIMSPQDIYQVAEFEVVNRELYTIPDRNPTPNGCLDRRLGTSDKMSTCETCGHKLAECSGHFAHIRLELPVFHIGFFKGIITILQSVCKTCSRILVDEAEAQNYLFRIRNPRLDGLQRRGLVKRIHEKCKKAAHCPHCGSANGTIKKTGALKLYHERARGRPSERDQQLKVDREKQFEAAIEANPDVKTHLSRANEDLNPMRVLSIFQNISDADVELLGMCPVEGRPEQLIWTHIPVPPVCIRPSVAMDAAAGSNEDDLTIKLMEIIHVNNVIRQSIEKGAQPQVLIENWDMLQIYCAMYINSELPGVQLPQQMQTKPTRGFCQRLKGKTGRFRGNLSGKRVDFSGRTVISPDPDLAINEVAVPELVAKVLTYPERVTRHNIKKMRQLIINGPDVHPGANYLATPDGRKLHLKYVRDRERTAAQLNIGDIVERHIDDGDVVLFNRQPSLHKLSIMCHYVKVRPWRTFRLNECACTPYNADFDGDEMNLHVPQTEEARAEALVLMGVKDNLITPRNGEPVIAATQDFITACYLLTRKDIFYDRAQMSLICSYMSDARMHVDLPPPAIVKPVEFWTGKQLFNIIIRPNTRSQVRINLETKNRSYSKGEDMCPSDGYVVIRDSTVMCGTLDKSLVGSGSKNTIFYIIMRDYGVDEAIAAMSRVAKMCARWLGNHGFSIGIDDVRPGARLVQMKDQLVMAGYGKCAEYIKEFQNNTLQLAPGCTAEQTLEAKMTGELSKIRDDAGQICLNELDRYNSPMVMAISGSKGSKINISQMIACVGQQVVSGARIADGFVNRTLPHFEVNSKTPAAKGFVKNSFYSGLTPTEFFFHTMGGREGLVDTAVKTAETGYMQRRLMKALEDLSVQYDYSVRNSSGQVVQFKYGADGLDPAAMEADDRPVSLSRVFTHCQWHRLPSEAENPLAPEHRGLLPVQLMQLVDRQVSIPAVAHRCTSLFIGELREFVYQLAAELAGLRQRAGLDAHTVTPGPVAEPPPAEAIPPSVKRATFGPVSSDARAFPLPELLDAQGVPYTAARVEAIHQAEMGLTARSFVDLLLRVTPAQMDLFFETILHKYLKAIIEPGTAVGALGAQSIGEPGTQMTLKTFHFAGVASMNVTLGVPRIKEIINASKLISTPIITTTLIANRSVQSARIVKGRIEKTLLSNIAEYIQETFSAQECYLSIKFDLDAIQALQLEVDMEQIRAAIIAAPKLKLKDRHVRVSASNRIRVYPPEDPKFTMYFMLQHLKAMLPNVIVKGVPTVNRAVVNTLGGGADTSYNLLVEGYGLRHVMATEGVDGTQTTSNHIMEVAQVLGIEAARTTIINEIQYTMSSHGMSIDMRHVMLLADLMTCKGEVLGITRFGIAKMKDSVLMLASFERTTDHLFDASYFAKRDAIEGVSECIIMGIPMPIGTGLFKVLQHMEASRGPAAADAHLHSMQDPQGPVEIVEFEPADPAAAAAPADAPPTVAGPGQFGLPRRKLLFDQPRFHGKK